MKKQYVSVFAVHHSHVWKRGASAAAVLGGPSEPAVLPFGMGEADARVGSVHWEPHNSLWVGGLAFILIDSFKSGKKYSKK